MVTLEGRSGFKSPRWVAVWVGLAASVLGAQPTWAQTCPGDPGVSLALSTTQPAIGSPLLITFGAPAGNVDVVLVSPSAGPTATPYGSLCVGLPALPVALVQPVPSFTLPVNVPYSTALSGTSFFMQFLTAAPSGTSTVLRSNSQRIDILPDSGPLFTGRRFELGVAALDAFELADVDHDGLLDAIAAASNTLSVALATAPGEFAPPTTFAIAGSATSSARSLAVSDINGDQHPDIAIGNANGSTDSIALLLGDGQGNFTNAPAINLGFEVWFVRFARMNGDSIDDLVAVGPKAWVLLGNGSGGFQLQYTSPSLPHFPSDLALADLNGDNRFDIVITGLSVASIAILYSTGPVTFGPIASIPATYWPDSVRVFDWNGDGIRDLAVASSFFRFLELIPGTGGGSFGTSKLFNFFPNTVSGPTDLEFGDINGDTHPDIVAPRLGESLVLLGDGAGNYALQATTLAKDFGRGRVRLIDIDTDGDLDLVTNSDSSHGMTVLRGLGNGAFDGPRRTAIAATSSHALADMDRDGTLDAVLGTGNDLSIWFGATTGAFTATPNLSLGATIRKIGVGDLDSDGALDVVAVTIHSGFDRIHLLQGDGSGGLALAATHDILNQVVTDLDLGDLDGDSTRDLVIVRHMTGGFADSIDAYFGIGLGPFPTPLVIPVAVDSEVELADLDRDQHDDIGVLSGAQGTTSILRDFQGGSFVGPTSVSVGSNVVAIHFADLDGDSDLDLIAGTPSGFGTATIGEIRILDGDGNGGFGAIQAMAGAGGSAFAAGDLDADGVPDLVASDGGAHVYLGGPSGLPASYGDFVTGLLSTDSRSIAIDDVNGDGRPDIVLVGIGDWFGYIDVIFHAAP